MKISVFMIVFCVVICSAVLANPTADSGNLISNGDFSTAVLNSVGSYWSFSSDNLNEWYTYSSGGADFYEVSEGGYATVATKDQSSRLLLQVIEAPGAGDYNLGFDYRLSDDSDMFSVVRVFSVRDDDGEFSVNMEDWSGTFSDTVSTSRIYDQGEWYSYLSSASDWENVTSEISVGEEIDYLVIYAAFSHDGTMNSLLNENADLDNFSMTQVVPTPSDFILCIVGLGVLLLMKKYIAPSYETSC